MLSPWDVLRGTVGRSTDRESETRATPAGNPPLEITGPEITGLAIIGLATARLATARLAIARLAAPVPTARDLTSCFPWAVPRV